MSQLRIFLDASVMKFAVDRRIVAWKEKVTFNWGGREMTAPVTRWGEDFPHERAHPVMREHSLTIPLIAHLARRERIELMTHTEALSEFWGLPATRDPRGLFLGAPVDRASDPISYSPVVIGGVKTPEQRRYDFLSSLTHPRFLELQRVTGANNPGPRRANQLADAFHIWTAEEAGADYLLTTDLRLVRSAATNRPEKPRIGVVAPRQLIRELLRKRRVIRLRDVVSWAWFQYRTKGRGPSEHPDEQLLDMSRRLRDHEDNRRGR